MTIITFVILKLAGWQQDDELALQQPADDSTPARGLPSPAELGPGDAPSAQLRRGHVAAHDQSEAAYQQLLPAPPAAVLQPAKFPRRRHDALARPATVAIPTVRPAAVAHVQQLAQVPAAQPPIARPPPDPAFAPPHSAPHGNVPQPEKRCQGPGSPDTQSAAGPVRFQPVGSHRTDRESIFILLRRVVL